MDSRGALRRAHPPLPSREIPAFVDTNVFVYAYDEDEPAKRARAREILADPDEPLTISTQVLVEFYSAATGKLSMPPDAAAEAVDALCEYRVLGADSELIRSAVELHRQGGLAWWDALIVRAAQVGRCGRLLTEDLNEGQRFGDVVVENPFA